MKKRKGIAFEMTTATARTAGKAEHYGKAVMGAISVPVLCLVPNNRAAHIYGNSAARQQTALCCSQPRVNNRGFPCLVSELEYVL